MREPARRIEAEARARRGRDRSIDEVDGFGERAGFVRIGKPDAPWRPVTLSLRARVSPPC